MEWFIGEHGTLDQSLPMERKSRRNDYYPSRLIVSSTASTAPSTSRTSTSEDKSTEDTVVVVRGHALKVARHHPPLIPIRDLIALICDMDTTDKGSLNIRNSFFERGFEPRLTHRFIGSDFDTPVLECTKTAIDRLLKFCSNLGSGRLAKKTESFRNSDARTELDQKVLQAAGAAAARPANRRNLATSNPRPGSGTASDNVRRGRRSLSSGSITSSTIPASNHRRGMSEIETGASGRQTGDGGSASTMAASLTSLRSRDAFQGSQSDEAMATTSPLLAAATASPGPDSAGTSRGEETASPSSLRARACSGGDLIGRKVAKQYVMPGTGACWFYGDVINTFTVSNRNTVQLQYFLCCSACRLEFSNPPDGCLAQSDHL